MSVFTQAPEVSVYRIWGVDIKDQVMYVLIIIQEGK